MHSYPNGKLTAFQKYFAEIKFLNSVNFLLFFIHNISRLLNINIDESVKNRIHFVRTYDR